MNSPEYLRLIVFLKRFGCNSREAATYLECLQNGTASVQEIAKRLNSNRITVHSTIQQLIKKGLLFETRKNKKRFIVAESPDVLYRILQRKSNELKIVKNELDAITKLLHSLQTHDQNMWKVRLYEGANDFKKVMEEMVEAQSDICVLCCSKSFADILNEVYLKDYYRRIAENGIHSRILCSRGLYVDTFQNDHLQYQLQIRILPASFECESGFYVWNDNVMLVSFKDNRVICSIIQNYDLAFLFKHVIFEFFWKAG